MLIVAEYFLQVGVAFVSGESPVIICWPSLCEAFKLAWLVYSKAVVHELVGGNLGLVIVEKSGESERLLVNHEVVERV